METLKDLFEYQLQMLYNVEDQLIQALPKMVENAEDSELKGAFSSHLEETKNHKKRLGEVLDELGIESDTEKCKSTAIKALIVEAESFLNKDLSDRVKNAGMITAAQHIEHYEIAGYGAVCTYAEELGYDTIAEMLKKTLDEEYGADEKLKELAKARINESAIQEP